MLTRSEATLLVRRTQLDAEHGALDLATYEQRDLELLRLAFQSIGRWDRPRPGVQTGVRNAVRRELDRRVRRSRGGTWRELNQRSGSTLTGRGREGGE